jgi:hypothetical protein
LKGCPGQVLGGEPTEVILTSVGLGTRHVDYEIDVNFSSRRAACTGLCLEVLFAKEREHLVLGALPEPHRQPIAMLPYRELADRRKERGHHDLVELLVRKATDEAAP